MLRRIRAAVRVAVGRVAREELRPLVPWVLVALPGPRVPVVLLDLPIQPADSDLRNRKPTPNLNPNLSPTHHRDPTRHLKAIPLLPEGLAHDRS